MNSVKGMIFFLMLCVFAGGCNSGVPDDDFFADIKPAYKEKRTEDASADLISEQAVQDTDVTGSRPGKNPFLTASEIISLVGKEREVLDNLDLSAVFISPGNSYAIVDGVIVKEEDWIKGKKVVKINKEDIVLKDDEGEYIVRIK